MYQNDDFYLKEAQKRVKRKKGFFFHLASYVITGTFFLSLNMATFEGDVWFHFPMMAWGVGLAFHYLGVFGVPFFGSLDKQWEQKEIERELARMGKSKGYAPPTALQTGSSHEIDELDLDNHYPFEKKEKEIKWRSEEQDNAKTLRKGFEDEFFK